MNRSLALLAAAATLSLALPSAAAVSVDAWSAAADVGPPRLTPKKGPRSDADAGEAAADAAGEAAAPAGESAPAPAGEAAPASAGEAAPAADPTPASAPAKGQPRKTPRRQPQGLAAAVATPDLARLPRFDAPAVVPGPADLYAGVTGSFGASGGLVGWASAIATPELVDHLRRAPLVPRPEPIGETLSPGERFRYDVTFSGNPTGIAEAHVVAREPGPFGEPDRVRLEGFAKTSGVVSLLTTLTYDITSWVDAVTGAPIEGQAITKRSSLGKSRRRETSTAFAGRGQVEITDTRHAETTSSTTIRRRIPGDTFDTLSIMAWVRALELAPGERARTHALDGKVLLRVDIVGKGPSRLEPMPSIGTALGIGVSDVYELEGSITRVDAFGVPLPGKKAYKMRAWISADGRRIPLVLESDIWLGVVRLILTQYDPPSAPAGERRGAP